MKHMIKKIGKTLFCLTFILIMTGCGADADISDLISSPEKVVPAKEILMENLTDSGYTITEHTTVEGSDLVIDRIVAEKDDKFIDITYGLTGENAEEIFHAYCELYDEDYYILALNGYFVYCVSDKKTFSKAGFTSTANIGVQYIND